MTNEQTKVWLTLNIAYNIINRNQRQCIEKIAHEYNNYLKRKYEDTFKEYLESKKNNKDLKGDILK